MKYIFFCLICYFNILHASNKDINTTIERLDVEKWDSVYYKYKLVDNIPYQLNKKDLSYQFNPIFVTYFLKDYMRRFKETKEKKFIVFSKNILSASLVKSEILNYNGLKARVYYYEDNGFVSRSYHRHYSGLTQGYFVKVLAELYKITNDNYFKNLSIEFFNSLLIPIEEGGVLFQKNNLYSIAEVPTSPHGWILNGWLSVIASLSDANKILENKRIDLLIKNNIRTLEFMIDKYDVPELNNSRYNLTQFFWFRLKEKKFKIKSITFDYPLDKDITIYPKENFIMNSKNKKKFSKWEPFVLFKDNLKLKNNTYEGSKQLIFNGILTRSNLYNSNNIVIEYENDIKSIKDIEFQVNIGEYDPLSSGPLRRKWLTINKKNIYFVKNKIVVKVDHEKLDEVLGYPTNFLKVFKNGRRNVYHSVHIRHLKFLATKYSSSKLMDYALKWEKYKSSWLKNKAYKKLFKENKVFIDKIDLK